MKYLPIIIIGLLIFLIGMNIVIVKYLAEIPDCTNLQAQLSEKKIEIGELKWEIEQIDKLFGDRLYEPKD